MLLMSEKRLGKRHVHFEGKTEHFQGNAKNLDRQRFYPYPHTMIPAANNQETWCDTLPGIFSSICKFISQHGSDVVDQVDELYDLIGCKGNFITCAQEQNLECVEKYLNCETGSLFSWEQRNIKQELKSALDAPLDIATTVSALAALAAEDVYQDGPTLADTSLTLLEKEKIQSVQTVTFQGVQAPVNSNDTVALYQSTSLDATCFLAFSGSNDKGDWVSNVAFSNDGTFCGKTKYHRGFAEEITRILENQQLEKIAQHWTKCDTLYVVGHSLGGALASMVAECINCDDDKCHDQQQILAYPKKDARLITFGAPAYATQASSLTLQGVRFWNTGDLVPFLSGWRDEDKADSWDPPEWMPENLATKFSQAPNTEYQHPRVVAVGMDRMNYWDYNIQDADNSILNFENSGTLLSKPMMLTMLNSLYGFVNENVQKEDENWDYWSHRMTEYRSRLQMGLEASTTTVPITCYDSHTGRPLGDSTIVTTVSACLDHAEGYKYMAFGCPQNDGFECWRGESINTNANYLDRKECEGSPMTDIGNGKSNGHCTGYPGGTYTVTYKGFDLPLGGWHREPVMSVASMKALR